MKKERENGYHEIFGVKLRRVTSILGRLKRYGLEEWQASCAIDFILRETVLPLRDNWMSLEQLKEADIERLKKAAMDESRRQNRAARSTGRRVHDIIHNYYLAAQDRSLFERIIKMEPNLALGLNAFEAWEDEFNVEMEQTERLVFSFSRKFSGTPDLQALITIPNENYEGGPRRRYIIDFKTGSPDPVNVLQLAAYVIAVEEMERRELDGAGLVYLDMETGRPRWKGYTRAELYMPFVLFEKLRSFVDLEDEWKGKDINGGPPAGLHDPPSNTSVADAPPSADAGGPPIFE